MYGQNIRNVTYAPYGYNGYRQRYLFKYFSFVNNTNFHLGFNFNIGLNLTSLIWLIITYILVIFNLFFLIII